MTYLVPIGRVQLELEYYCFFFEKLPAFLKYGDVMFQALRIHY